MHKSNVFLRRATPDDKVFLLELRNDKLVRKNSFNTKPVSLEEHTEWLDKVINDKNENIYILTDGTEDFGQIRLSVAGDIAYVSYSIKQGKRGIGLGKIMLALAEQSIYNERGKIQLVGKVKKDNVASQSVFKALGYTQAEDEAYYRFHKLTSGISVAGIQCEKKSI